jgi:hypothetical protein
MTIDELIAKLPDSVALDNYVEIGRELSLSERTYLIVRGQLVDNVYDTYDTYDVARDVLCDLDGITEEDVHRATDDEAWPDFVDAVESRLTGDVLAGHLAKTGHTVFRFYIPTGDRTSCELTWEAYRLSPEDKTAEAARLTELLGLDDDATRATMYEIIENASYGGYLCVLARMDFEFFYNNIRKPLDQPGTSVTLRFKRPHVAIADFINGSGHSDTLEEDVVLTIHHDDLQRASTYPFAVDGKGAGTGYGFSDETCGMVLSCLNNVPEVSITSMVSA